MGVIREGKRRRKESNFLSFSFSQIIILFVFLLCLFTFDRRTGIVYYVVDSDETCFFFIYLNFISSGGEVEGRGVTTWETKKLNFLRSAGGGSKQYLCCMHMVYLKECQSVSRDCRQRCERHGENVKGKNACVGVRVRASKNKMDKRRKKARFNEFFCIF